MPFALAAKTGFPDKEVLVVLGNGSFGLNSLEFDTCARHLSDRPDQQTIDFARLRERTLGAFDK